MPAQVYIVLFRGVGGDTTLPTAPLREALSAAGFGNVATYIATGNVVLTSELPAEKVSACVATIAREKLGFAKPVFVRSATQWAKLVKDNPFPQGAKDGRSLHAFVFDERPAGAALAALAAKATGREEIAVKAGTLYFYAPDGFGRSKLPVAIEKAFGGATTARNWNTVLKLADLAKAASRSGPSAG